MNHIRTKYNETMLSLIMPVFNNRDITENAILSLQATISHLNYEIIIIDDCSGPETIQYLESLNATNIKVIFNTENKGYAKNNNIGAHASQGKFLFFVNNDIVFLPGWADPIIALLESRPNVGAVGNIQINPTIQQVDHSGIFFDLNGIGVHARKINNSQFFSQWSAVTGACFGIKKSLFLEIGGFHEDYRNGFEDADLCLTLQKAGYNHFVANTSKVYHLVSSSEGRFDHADKNYQLYMARHGEFAKTLGKKEYLAHYPYRNGNFSLPKFIKAKANSLKNS